MDQVPSLDHEPDSQSTVVDILPPGSRAAEGTCVSMTGRIVLQVAVRVTTKFRPALADGKDFAKELRYDLKAIPIRR